ncbi:MAG: ATP-binding cassette domain-containing protein, partial [Opitutales bacterium]
MLLSYRNLTVSFGGPKLLDDAGLTIAKRERICLLGRNGEGKSTLLRILNAQIQPDHGEIEAIPGLRVGNLDQEVLTELEGTVFEVVAEGLSQAARNIAQYHHLLHEIG